jgi:hypothetical protein
LALRKKIGFFRRRSPTNGAPLWPASPPATSLKAPASLAVVWRAKIGGMDASLMKRMKELEDENRRLKKMYADERLKAEIVQEALAKKW